MGDGSDVHLNEALSYDYWISRFPVTNAQYQAFVESGGYGESHYWKEAEKAGLWKDGSFKGRWEDEDRAQPVESGEPFNLSNHPVVGVTWYEALALTRWLTEHLRKYRLLPQDWEISLPSEAEWEKAVRGGLKVPTQPVILAIGGGLKSLPKVQSNPNLVPKRLYPWGDKADANRANYRDTDVGFTNALGCFRGGAGPYGAEELSGNVWEWTRSLWGRDLTKTDFIYPYNPADGREKLDASDEVCRVLRGGTFLNSVYYVRCANRNSHNPDFRIHNIGFRVVASPSTSGL
jgi:formylglycine-generating enzyme required for sulfatase activity